MNNIGSTKIDNCELVNIVGIFAGTMGIDLKIVDKNLLKWRENGEYEEILTLDEIYSQLKSIDEYKDEDIFTVVINTPLHGEIYQCGNYADGAWVKYGETIGYA